MTTPELQLHWPDCPHCGYDNDAPAAEALHMEPGGVLRDRYIVGKGWALADLA